MFFGNDSVQFYTNLVIAILAILLFILFGLDTYYRIKKGKEKEGHQGIKKP